MDNVIATSKRFFETDSKRKLLADLDNRYPDLRELIPERERLKYYRKLLKDNKETNNVIYLESL